MGWKQTSEFTVVFLITYDQLSSSLKRQGYFWAKILRTL